MEDTGGEFLCLSGNQSSEPLEILRISTVYCNNVPSDEEEAWQSCRISQEGIWCLEKVKKSPYLDGNNCSERGRRGGWRGR